jgi:RNA polymerase sigma factor (TIGR02999 family)
VYGFLPSLGKTGNGGETGHLGGIFLRMETDALIASLYEELRTIARREHFNAGGPQTLPATALINEAYIKLQKSNDWESKAHFLGCAATAMRHVLIDAARARMAGKRGGPHVDYTRSIETLANEETDDQVVRLGEALVLLAKIDQKLAQVVDCRFFAGMDEAETARVMGVTDRTIRRWWTQARALIHSELQAA